MKVSRNEQEKPLAVLVYDPSLLRLWMENALGQMFRVCVFSNAEDALTFARSTQTFDALITDLDLALSALGGCNIVRDVRTRFPQVPIFVFSNASAQDHRLVILRGMPGVRFMSAFDVFFVARRVQKALSELEAVA
ncbi:Orn/Lys/Arg decarboxylase N-terminal domain-containing protein [Bdellovibrionota bacterium FG-1]